MHCYSIQSKGPKTKQAQNRHYPSRVGVYNAFRNSSELNFARFFFLFFDYKGYRYMVFQDSTSYSSNKTSLFESPIYERSQEDRDLCLRFRYLIYGAGRQFLRLYHQFELRNHTRRLMWVVNETSNANQWWKYGSVALPGGAKFRVFMHFF